MHVAEYVAAASAVMSAGEITEVALAGCLVADLGFGVGLQVIIR